MNEINYLVVGEKWLEESIKGITERKLIHSTSIITENNQQ
jgi:hypothetical protein